MGKPQVTRARLLFGVATLLGGFSTFQAFYYVQFFSERPQPFWLLVGLNFGFWYPWAILAPAVLWVVRRYPLTRERWLRSIPVHLVAVLIIVLVHTVMSDTIRYYLTRLAFGDSWAMKMTWFTLVARSYVLNFDWEMATYLAIVGAFHAADYYRESQDRALRASQLETRLAEAQLQALQRQLHPHFLFNTLNAISALMHRDVEAADQMLSKLSDLLRMALDQPGRQEVSLKDELEFLQKYLEIEQARFGDRLTVRFDIEPQTLDAQMPNLLLQPLVENSVRHAVAVRIEPGLIEIHSRRVGDSLELTVRDNGPGMVPGTLATKSKGVGLANTRSRLERLYGPAQRLTFSDPPGGGLLVTVTIPFHAEEVAEVVEHEEYGEDNIKGVA
jgi:two-component system, LytTR family, sensor kinase